jgi:hypothetical protein
MILLYPQECETFVWSEEEEHDQGVTVNEKQRI